MVYRIYTDAATHVQKKYSSVAFLVLQGSNYIKAYNEIIEESTTAEAESIAVGRALLYLINEIDPSPEDEVILFCDSLYVIKFARKCLKLSKSKTKANFDDCVQPTKAYWLSDIYDKIPMIRAKLTISKIKAHQQGMNPHCYVDRLAKLGLSTK